MDVTLMDSTLERITELRSTLNVREGSPYAAHLDDLCEYMSRQLAIASLENRVATLDEVSHLLREVRTTWIMVLSCMTERIQ